MFGMRMRMKRGSISVNLWGSLSGLLHILAASLTWLTKNLSLQGQIKSIVLSTREEEMDDYPLLNLQQTLRNELSKMYTCCLS